MSFITIIIDDSRNVGKEIHHSSSITDQILYLMWRIQANLALTFPSWDQVKGIPYAIHLKHHHFHPFHPQIHIEVSFTSQFYEYLDQNKGLSSHR